MDQQFWKLLMDKTGFPEEAREEFLRAGRQLKDAGQEEALDGAVEFFYNHDLDIKLAAPLLEDVSQESGVALYTLWELFLMEAAKPARDAYLQKGTPEQVVWDTFSDLKYKAMECKNVQGVWGNFVSFWYPIFYSCDIVKLGRLEFENVLYEGEPYEKNGLTVRPGDKVKSVHIPSSGEPFDWNARLDSYKRAYEFFRDELDGKPLVCQCESWLLYPRNREILSPASNIIGFLGDWDIVQSGETPEFHDAWRVFGADYKKPLDQLPERTSMQRAFKRWLLAGNQTGWGLGLLIFDGKTVLNR